MNIRHATPEDLPGLLELYETARSTMRQSGNPHQWKNGYPSEAVLKEDLSLNRLYCVEQAGGVIGAFVFFLGPEPDYAKIDGAWKNDGPYGVIHRVAAKPGLGVSKHIFAFAWDRCKNLRIDTHQDNAIMRHVLQKQGFVYCGLVHTADGAERLAYQKTAKDS